MWYAIGGVLIVLGLGAVLWGCSVARREQKPHDERWDWFV